MQSETAAAAAATASTYADGGKYCNIEKLPSEVLDNLYIYEEIKEYQYACNDGKWMVFFGNYNELDAFWLKAKGAYRAGKLKFVDSIKSSTKAKNPKASGSAVGTVMFHCGPSSDEKKMLEIVAELAKQLPLQDKMIYYKSDELSKLGTRRTGQAVNHIYAYRNGVPIGSTKHSLNKMGSNSSRSSNSSRNSEKPPSRNQFYLRNQNGLLGSNPSSPRSSSAAGSAAAGSAAAGSAAAGSAAGSAVETAPYFIRNSTQSLDDVNKIGISNYNRKSQYNNQIIAGPIRKYSDGLNPMDFNWRRQSDDGNFDNSNNGESNNGESTTNNESNNESTILSTSSSSSSSFIERAAAAAGSAAAVGTATPHYPNTNYQQKVKRNLDFNWRSLDDTP